MRNTRLVRRLISCTIIAGAAALSPFHALTAATTAPPRVVIGEVAWAGSSLSSADEWLELWNLGDATTSLAGWSLRGAADAPLFFSATATIEPHSVFLISNYTSNELKSAFATSVVSHIVTTTISLSNTALKLELLDPSEKIRDAAGSGNEPPAGASLPIKKSMVRNGDGWINATSSYNLKPSLNDLGTPGVCDECFSRVIGATSTPISSIPVMITPTTTRNDVASSISASSSVVYASSTQPPIAKTISITPMQTLSSPLKPNYGMLRLNEVAPAPASGKEWVEIVTLDATQKISLQGCQLFDAKGRMLTLGNETLDPTGSRYLTVSLPTSRLNNSGDMVALYDPNGRLLDVMQFEKTSRNASWIRFPDLNGDWQMTTELTPNNANVMKQEVMGVTEMADVGAQRAVPTEQTSDERPVLPLAGSSSEGGTTPALAHLLAALQTDEERRMTRQQLDQVQETVEQIRQDFRAAYRQLRTEPTRTVAPHKRTGKRVVQHATQAAHPLSFDMLTHENSPQTRVRLAGRVGSPPGLLARHSFLLHAPDGRGLRVVVSAQQRLPQLGTDVAVVGTLRLDDRSVPSLQMAARDKWMQQPTSTEMFVPRVVDLLAPAAEDAWSLVYVTGTVLQVAGQHVTLDLHDASVTVVMKSVINYRAKRLVQGDLIAVIGILDLTRDTPHLLPRTSQEVTILKHAEPKQERLSFSSSRLASLPSWAPLGAAGGAVLATEGAKYWHRRRKLEKLKQKTKA